MEVSVITLEDNKEYIVIDKLEDENTIYFFLTLQEEDNITIYKHKKELQDNSLEKLGSIEEMGYAFSLFLKKHKNMTSM